MIKKIINIINKILGCNEDEIIKKEKAILHKFLNNGDLTIKEDKIFLNAIKAGRLKITVKTPQDDI